VLGGVLEWEGLGLAVALAAAGASLYMLGLIWFVQVVHYPLMARVGPEAVKDYARAHTGRTFWVTGPQMVVELGLTLATALVLMGERPLVASLALAALGVCLVNWVSTFFIQIPLHGRLQATGDAAEVRGLVRTNWIRSVAWTAKCGLSLAVVWLVSAPSG